MAYVIIFGTKVPKIVEPAGFGNHTLVIHWSLFSHMYHLR
jgi:hypothetical protein